MKASTFPSGDQEVGTWMYSLVFNRSTPATAAVCQLPENVRRTFLVRFKRYPLAIWCPNWVIGL